MRGDFEDWAKDLPSDKYVAAAALFPGSPTHIDPSQHSARSRLSQDFSDCRVPTKEIWLDALVEQWHEVKDFVEEPQPFFSLPEVEAGGLLEDLAHRLASRCQQDENMFRATVIEELRSHPLASVKIQAAQGIDAEGTHSIRFTIRNTGSKTIPPYGICIFHPRRGSLFMFPSKVSGELLPDQEREHIMPVFVHGQKARFCPNLSTDRNGRPLTDADDRGVAFRMVLEHSDKVLYENERVGLAFVRVLRKALDQGSLQDISFEEWMEMQSDE